MVHPSRPIRLFLDAGVIIEGCFALWGASKAVLILATLSNNYTVVLAESIKREVERAVASKIAPLEVSEALEIAGSVAGWLQRVRIECYPLPSEAETAQHFATLMPVLRHVNDLVSVVTALLARPDWVISTNTAHWNAELAQRTGLRIATPLEFLRQLRPSEHT